MGKAGKAYGVVVNSKHVNDQMVKGKLRAQELRKEFLAKMKERAQGANH